MRLGDGARSNKRWHSQCLRASVRSREGKVASRIIFGACLPLCPREMKKIKGGIKDPNNYKGDRMRRREKKKLRSENRCRMLRSDMEGCCERMEEEERHKGFEVCGRDVFVSCGLRGVNWDSG